MINDNEKEGSRQLQEKNKKGRKNARDEDAEKINYLMCFIGLFAGVI